MLVSALIFFSFISVAAPIVGKYISWVYTVELNFNSIKNLSAKYSQPQEWRSYFASLMVFNITCIIGTFIIIYFQSYLPLNGNLKEQISFSAIINAAVSFVTGTFWQSHNPETQLSIFSHIFAMTMQNFLSGATGIAVFIAFIRGITNNKNPYIGNFYNDFLRAFVLILLPISFIIAIILINYGVPHDFNESVSYTNLTGRQSELFVGPIAGQMSIKTFVANGGSILASSSGHPFEAPSREVVIFSLFLVVLMPVAMIFTYGFLVDALKLSWSLYGIIVLVMIISLLVINLGETTYGIPLILENNSLTDNFNYSGKELIYDKFPSLMWILSVTISSSGSVNACLENYSPLSTIVMFSNLVISKFVIEGVGAGFFAMLSYLIIAVFLRGLITGNTANFFGNRITINEINYVTIVFLIMPVGVLLLSGITLLSPYAKELITYHGSQAITDITYNIASNFANNGSGFTGVNLSNNYFNYITALAMFVGRYLIIYYSLAISGSFAEKQLIRHELNKNNKSNIELSIFLMLTVFMVGTITFLPLIILGPLLEFFNM